MQQQISTRNISVTWRGKKFILEMNLAATLKDLAYELQKLTDVKADTMRLIVPQGSDKSSKLLSPFSEEHSGLSLQETFFFQAKSVRMMGVPKDEVDEILQNAKANLRIAGFGEEENRLRQRMSNRPHSSLKLPQGQYIFCEFRTLHLPGVELDPPASEALRRMHMLAADPGIVAIMNKHRWRVGIMTEMAPVGYVGVSPKCILGFNKNQGEEISLRLRTDDLKGFRKYESIKKTLFHELAHMVYSEHDADFFALDKQLNQEAAALDWTRSKGHRLTGVNHSANYEEFWDHDHATSSQKLGGKKHDQLASARATSVAAAYERLANVSQIVTDHDSEDFGVGAYQEPESMDVVEIEKLNVENSDYALRKDDDEPNPDDCSNRPYKLEPDPDDIEGGDAMESEPYSESTEGIIISEPDPDDSQMTLFLPPVTEREIARSKPHEEPDPDDSEASNETVDEPDPDDSKEEQKQMGCRSIARHDQGGVVASHMTESTEGIIISEPDPDDSQMTQFLPPVTEREIARSKPHEEPDPDDSEASNKTVDEPDPDDSKEEQKQMGCRNIAIPDQGGVVASHITETQIHLSRDDKNPDGDDYQAKGVTPINPRTQIDESYSDDQEIQRIQDPVTMICTRLQKAIVMLQSEVSTTEIAGVLQTLFRIIRNLIEHPSEIKFKRIRKDNPLIRRNVANYKAAMEILTLIGFIEDVVLDEIGRAETYLVLKRNDPGLLWLAKSSLETCIAY